MYSLPPGITSILTASQVQLTPTLEAGGITADGKWKSKRNEIVNNIKRETNEHINTYVHTNSCNKNTISLGARLPWINKQVSEEKRGVGGVTYVCSCCSQRKKERQQTFNKKESGTHTPPFPRSDPQNSCNTLSFGSLVLSLLIAGHPKTKIKGLIT